jgi:hypothetical protein
MRAARLETLIWVLIYGGLLAIGAGLAVRDAHAPIGWACVAVGGLAAAAGVVLVWVRSRMGEGDGR